MLTKVKGVETQLCPTGSNKIDALFLQILKPHNLVESVGHSASYSQIARNDWPKRGRKLMMADYFLSVMAKIDKHELHMKV